MLVFLVLNYQILTFLKIIEMFLYLFLILLLHKLDVF